MRVYSDEALSVGTTLDLELLLEGNTSARCWARVAWVEPLPASAGAAYDIGLEFTDMTDDDRARLDRALSER